MKTRQASIERKTQETEITLKLILDGTGQAEIDTGIGFLDHMLGNMAKHAGFDLSIKARGDLHIDDHHTAEDVAICLGLALDRCLGERAGIQRFGFAYAPLDEALARVVIDLSGRSHARIELGLGREYLGSLSTENIAHFLSSLAHAARMTLHAEVLQGSNDHHRTEASFKALALALRAAVARSLQPGIPSTKGSL